MWRLLVCVVFLAGCATISPRFEQDVATTFAQDHMRKLETADLELYYPEEYATEAKRVAARASECVQLLRSRDVNQREYGKVLLYLTSANYNNAYVGGQSQGEPLHSLNPLSVNEEIFHFYGLGGAEAGDIACHEMFHFVHYEQTHGFWRVINAVFGPVVPPQTFLERWFTEGAAQFYEGRLFRNVGRPSSPFYRGSFDSFIAMRGGDVQPGDLQIGQRELNPFSGAYITGLHFIEWLVETYGEDKLWAVMDLQGNSIFSPFGYTLRFKAVYGLSVGALIDQWRDELRASFKPRVRPDDERVLLPDVGQLVRITAHASTGAIALVSSGNEQVPLLRILEADGTVRVEKHLVRLGPDREWVYVGPGTMSGLSFTADGRWLYLLNDDLIDRGDTRAQIWKIDAQTGETVKVFQNVGRGMGGSISADGQSYTFVDFPPGHSRIVVRDLERGTDVVVVDAPPGTSLASPSWNPSQTKLIYSRTDGTGWNLVLHDDTGETSITFDGAFNYGARWSDDTHVIFARTAGAYLQAHRLDVTAPDQIERLTDAPYGVLDPVPAPGGVIVAARDGVHWSIDRATDRVLETVTNVTNSEPRLAHVSPALQVLKDEAYSSLDHLFLPQLRAPNVTATLTDRINVGVGASLMGRDRLGKHSWIINGLLFVPTITQNSVSIGYRNLTLAPWSIVASAARDQFAATTTSPGEVYWTGGIYAGRTIFTVPISFGVQTEVWQPFGFAIQKYIGPTFSLAYSSVESTQYAGAQRALSFSLDASAYPKLIGSDRDLFDLRSSVGVAIPLPFSKRHSLTASVTGRVLPGAPSNTLRIGGVSSFNSIYQSVSTSRFPAGPGVFLPGSFVEVLRGYDDFAIRAQYAAIINARYRYSVIIDRGFASLLYLFPSLFFRQVDVEIFGAGAVTETQTAKAAGAAVFLRTNIGGIFPFSLVYQFAWRFDFGLPPLHVVAFSFE